MIFIIIIYLLAGIVTGLLATMFGFGGGFVVVPLLFWLLSDYGVSHAVVMHVAVGTSLMLMFINMFYASWLHYLEKNIDLNLLKKMLPLLILGAITGSFLATQLSTEGLKYAFILLVFVILLRSIKFEFFKKENIAIDLRPKKWLINLISFFTGMVASLLGIGGSVIIVPFFRRYNLPMPKATGLANALAVPSGLIGSIIFMCEGFYVNRLPSYSTGFVYWPALVLILLGSIFGAKAGIYFSKIISDKFYGKIYCFLLLLVIVVMFLT